MQWSRELSVGSGPLADGLSVALQRAVVLVAPELEREEGYLKLRHRDKAAAEALRDGLQALGENSAQLVARVGAQVTEADWAEQVGTLREEAALWSLLAARVDEALFGHDPGLGRCLQRRLAIAWQAEWELKC